MTNTYFSLVDLLLFDMTGINIKKILIVIPVIKVVHSVVMKGDSRTFHFQYHFTTLAYSTAVKNTPAPREIMSSIPGMKNVVN